MYLNDPMNVRSWKYTAVSRDGKRSGPFHINEYLTGAALGYQRPARITLKCALWIVHGWSQLGDTHYRLVIPNPQK
jgi:hypothetical protein